MEVIFNNDTLNLSISEVLSLVFEEEDIIIGEYSSCGDYDRNLKYIFFSEND